MRNLKYTDCITEISGLLTKLHRSSLEEEGSVHTLVVSTFAVSFFFFSSLLFQINGSYLSLWSFAFLCLQSSSPATHGSSKGGRVNRQQHSLENLGRRIKLGIMTPKLLQGLNSTTKEPRKSLYKK